MLLRFPMLFAMALLFLAGAAAYAASVPTSTDEARALAGRLLPESTAGHAVAAFPSSTDQARALAGRLLPPTSPRVAIAGFPSSTDEARAAGWRVPQASPRPPATAVATKARGTATSLDPVADPPAQKAEAAPPQHVACQTPCSCRRG